MTTPQENETPTQEDRIARLERKVAAIEDWASKAGKIFTRLSEETVRLSKLIDAQESRQKVVGGMSDIASKLEDMLSKNRKGGGC